MYILNALERGLEYCEVLKERVVVDLVLSLGLQNNVNLNPKP